MLNELGLRLETKRYGSSAAQATADISQASIDVDAFLHPIVNAYRFEETIRMFRGCALLSWAAINNANLLDSSNLMDLGEVETSDLRYFCQSVDDLFENPSLMDRCQRLTRKEKLRILKFKLKRFTNLGGRRILREAFDARAFQSREARSRVTWSLRVGAR